MNTINIISSAILFAAIACALFVLKFRHEPDHSIKCPFCGTVMDFEGNIVSQDKSAHVIKLSKFKKLGYPHAYTCPQCGEKIII